MGWFGGVSLARSTAEIGVGAVVRQTEDGFTLVMAVLHACELTGVFAGALIAVVTVLDDYGRFAK